MSIDEATVRRVAKLARLKVPEADIAPLTGELSKILNWFTQLQEVNVDGVEPLTSVANTTLRQREDKVTDGNYPEAVLQNAPASSAGFFAVPKVVE